MKIKEKILSKNIEQNQAKEEPQPIVYIDESGINNNLTREYGWSGKGEIIFDNKKSKPTEKLNLMGGLLNGEIMAPMAYPFYTDTEVFNTWLEQFLIPVLPKNCILVMDNASFHKSPKTQEIIEGNGHEILFLTTYSPDLNPIEKHWAIIIQRNPPALPGRQ